MGVTLDGGVIRLSGDVRIEDAEALVRLLQAAPGRTVDVTGVATLHTAVVQVLVAFGAALSGRAADGFLAEWVLPAVEGSKQSFFEEKDQKTFDSAVAVTHGQADGG